MSPRPYERRGAAPGPRPTGKCPACGLWWRLRRDSSLRRHQAYDTDDWAENRSCVGSHKAPETVHVAEAAG